jgi:hypothetical protein
MDRPEWEGPRGGPPLRGHHHAGRGISFADGGGCLAIAEICPTLGDLPQRQLSKNAANVLIMSYRPFGPNCA